VTLSVVGKVMKMQGYEIDQGGLGGGVLSGCSHPCIGGWLIRRKHTGRLHIAYLARSG
jgi:hypothetical protein